MIGTQLRELFGEDIACTIEDFLYTRHYWSLETCLLEDDYDGVWDFLTREQTFSLRHLHVRLLYYTRSVLMLNLLLDSLNPTFSKKERAIVFYASHGRAELLQFLLDKYKIPDCSLDKAVYEIEFLLGRMDMDYGTEGYYTFRHQASWDLFWTGTFAPASEHKSTVKRNLEVCLQILRRELDKMKP